MDGQMFFKTLLSSNSTAAPIKFTGNDETNCFPVSGPEVWASSCHLQAGKFTSS